MRTISFEAFALIAAVLATFGIHQFVNAKQTPGAEPTTLEPEERSESPPEIDNCPNSLEALPPEYASDPRARHGPLVVAFKRQYLVGLYRDGKIVTEAGTRGCFPVAMGAWPYEPKFRTDFMSTPEGWYHTVSKHTTDRSDQWPHTSFYKGLFVSYPNEQDVTRALEHEVISEDLATSLRATIARGDLPPQNTAMGGAILIHGWDTEFKNGTAGCVGVDDDNIDWLFDRVEERDPILILPWRRVLFSDGSFGTDNTVPAEREPDFSLDTFNDMIDWTASEQSGGIIMKPVVITIDASND